MAGLKGKKIKISRRTERGGEDGEDIKNVKSKLKRGRESVGKTKI